MDIKIDSANEHFKFRVAGIVEHNGKYLAVKMDNNNFYCLPGGHAEIGEDTVTATKREMSEELGYEVKVKRLAGIAQNFYDRLTKDGATKKFHEFSYYYIVEPANADQINENNYTRQENDKGVIKTLQFVWLTKEEFKKVPFRPQFAANLLSSNRPLHIINRGDDAEIAEM